MPDPLNTFFVEEILWRLANGYAVGSRGDGWVFNRSKQFDVVSDAIVQSLLRRGALVTEKYGKLTRCFERMPEAGQGGKRGAYYILNPITGTCPAQSERRLMRRFLDSDDNYLFRAGRKSDWFYGQLAQVIDFEHVRVALQRGYVTVERGSDLTTLSLTLRGHKALGAHHGRGLARVDFRRSEKARGRAKAAAMQIAA